jgi:hypothetical protein
MRARPIVRILVAFSCLAAGCRRDDADGAWVQSGEYRFLWRDGAGTLMRGGQPVATLERPFDYFIADGQATVRCGGAGETLTALGHDATVSAELVCANGARLRAHLTARAVDGGAADTQFEFEARTEVLGQAGDGLAQQLHFTVPARDEKAEAVIPGVWYKRNVHVEDCGPGIAAAPSLHVREDRATYPAVALRSGDDTLTLMRAAPAAFDAAPTTDGNPAALLTTGAALYTRGGGTDVAGVGFDLGASGGYGITASFPYYEGPYSQQVRVNAAELTPAFDGWCRAGAVRGFLAWPLVRRAGLVSRWRLIPSRPETFAALLGEQWRTAYALYAPPPRAPAGNAASVRDALARFVAAHYDHRSVVAGFTYVMTVPRATVLLPYTEPGFTGRAFLNARYLLTQGRAEHDAAWVAMAESVYDTWITAGTQNGFFHDVWDMRKNRPASDRSVNGAPDGVGIRREAEALWALIGAVGDEAARGNGRDAWRAAAVAHLENLLTLQRNDGSFCRRYRYDGRCLDPNAGGTSAVVPALVHGYRLTGDARYRRAADGAAAFVARAFIAPAEYFASTLDNPSENKEAATYALYVARLMAEEHPEEPVWIERAAQAADAALTWIQLTDVPFYAPTLLGRLGYRTRGLGNVAAGGGNLDAYAFELPGTLVWLGGATGDGRYTELGRLILGAAMDTVAVPADMKGLAELGLAPEGIQKTMFSYFTGGKGAYAPFSALGWTTASVFQAMDEVERVTGQSADVFLADVPYAGKP